MATGILTSTLNDDPSGADLFDIPVDVQAGMLTFALEDPIFHSVIKPVEVHLHPGTQGLPDFFEHLETIGTVKEPALGPFGLYVQPVLLVVDAKVDISLPDPAEVQDGSGVGGEAFEPAFPPQADNEPAEGSARSRRART